MYRQQHIITALGDLAGPGGPGVENILAHVREDLPGFLKRLGAATTHESQGTCRGRRDPAGHRAVHKAYAQRRRSLTHLARSSGVDRAAVKYRGVGIQACQQATLAQVGSGNMFARGQHGDHIVRACCRLRCGGRDIRP